MAAWTLATAQTHLAAWMEADLRVSEGQAYEINTGGSSRKLTRADSDMILSKINFWKREVEKLSTDKPAQGKVRFGAPLDDY